jgi:catechol 2,3-dioxygenase-like lactoylglutathione lyase family enzyme
MKLKKTIPALPVKDIKQSCKYYSDKLGFTIRHQEEDFAIAVRDEVEIHLWRACDKSWKWRSLFLVLKPIWTGAESFLAGTASCRIQVQGIEALFEEYRRQGVLHSTDTKVELQYWGDREFAAVDNFGNLLTFYETVL